MSEPSEYIVAHTREWEAADLDSADYLWLNPAGALREDADTAWDPDAAALLVQANSLGRRPRGLTGTGGIGSTTLVPERSAALLRSQRFRGLRFDAVKLVHGWGAERRDADDSHERWWAVASDLKLPPMSPSVRRSMPQGLKPPLIADRMEWRYVLLTNPPFADFQPVYLKSDWAAVEPFDVAGTYEMASGHPFLHLLIVSRRFHRYCRKQGMEAKWVPVCFEDG